MRSIFLVGGFVGFSIVAISGFLAGRSGDRVLTDASLACLASAFLFRWFWSQVAKSVGEIVKKKEALRQAAEEAAKAANAVPVTPAATARPVSVAAVKTK